jgi:hypothetical protein
MTSESYPYSRARRNEFAPAAHGDDGSKTTLQGKIRVFGSFGFVPRYGKDLRTGRNSFCGAASHWKW